ncbi:MAG: glycosyltransferase family 2 protein [Pseudomonadota bacterium]|nr:glycosyltransferase family 2 protein [Pseudomonadota bacterium]
MTHPNPESTAPPDPTVVTVVLNWNGCADTLRCLNSLTAACPEQPSVLVVDNGSTDDSVAEIRARYPQVEVIETRRNLGYAGGNNVGIKRALDTGAEYVFVLNNDTEAEPGLFNALLETAAQDPKTAAIGPVICSAHEPDLISTAGERFGPGLLNCVHHLEGAPRSALPSTPWIDCDWVTGAAILLRADALREIGLFEERFFLVWEESDWCLRARRAGYNSRVCTAAFVRHKVAATFGGEDSPLRAYFSARNQLLFAERHLPRREWLTLVFAALRRLVPKVAWTSSPGTGPVRRVYWALKDAILLWKSPRQRALRQATRDYLFRRFGDCPPSIRMR